jgi:hypothetical protein
MIKTQFSDGMQGKMEQCAKRQHVATNSSPCKHCSDRYQQKAQQRNDQSGCRCTERQSESTKDHAAGRDKHKQR